MNTLPSSATREDERPRDDESCVQQGRIEGVEGCTLQIQQSSVEKKLRVMKREAVVLRNVIKGSRQSVGGGRLQDFYRLTLSLQARKVT